MEVQSIIDEITTKECVKCRFGKCLIALKAVRDETTVPSQPAPEQPPATQGKKRYDNRGGHCKGSKVCKKCAKSKALDQFSKNSLCKDGHEGTCIECKRIYANDRYKRLNSKPSNNPEIPDGSAAIDPAKPKSYRDCNLCNSPCSTKDKYIKHTQLVHSMTVTE